MDVAGSVHIVGGGRRIRVGRRPDISRNRINKKSLARCAFSTERGAIAFSVLGQIKQRWPSLKGTRPLIELVFHLI